MFKYIRKYTFEDDKEYECRVTSTFTTLSEEFQITHYCIEQDWAMIEYREKATALTITKKVRGFSK